MTQTTETAGIVRGLFAGSFAEELLEPYPKMREDEKENLELLLDSVRKFAEKEIDSQAIDEGGMIPESVKDGLAELGVMGVTIPEEHGGFGWSATAYCRMMEEISLYDASVATHIGGHLSLGSKGIVLYGTEEQKKRFLPRIATGEWVCAYALTEPSSGSDAQALKSRAVFDPARNVWVLNGNKIWCTNGGYAHVIQTFARTPMPDGREKITAFLVTRDMPGFTSGKPEYKMGIKGSNTVELAFQDVAIPAENVVGEVGRGFKIAVEILNTGRLSLAAGCVGGIKVAIRKALEHGETRKQFGRPIVEFEMLKEKFAEMAVDAFALESMVYLAAGLHDRKLDASLEAAICKIFGTEALWRATNHAVQVAGGTGFMREYPYERAVRDARVNMIFEGTNEILRVLIALTGMQKRGEYLKTVGEALKSPLSHTSVLSEYAAGRLRRAVKPERLRFVHDALRDQAAALETQAADFAGQVEAVIRRERSHIVEREYLQRRLADAAIDLYAMLATIARVSASIKERGEEAAAEEIRMARVFCDAAWRRCRRNVRAVESNQDADLDAIVAGLRERKGYVSSLG
jgi:acyl-CoA dehydrogenase family protein 9